MASAAKYQASAVRVLLAHNDRQIANPSNHDIDPSHSHENYSLLDHGEMTPYDYYRARRQELHCLNRADVKPLIGWVLTQPQDLPREEEELFFRASYDFVAARYGPENMVQAVVHKDESGQPHLHVCFIPAVPDLKHGGEKICANDVLTRKDLKSFHTDWQQYLDAQGLHASVYTGVTARQGGNITVAQLKQQRDMIHHVEVTVQPEPERTSRWDQPRTVDQDRSIERGRW